MIASDGAPPAPPYFDDDDMIDDYMDVDEEDFGGPPPPPPPPRQSTTPAAAGATPVQDDNGGDFYYDEDDEDQAALWNQMVEDEEQTQNQQQPPQASVEESSFGATASAENTRGASEQNNNNTNTNTVEDYLAARRQEHQLYNFERYKKNQDWRTTPSSNNNSNDDSSKPSRRRDRLLASSSSSSSYKTKTVAPEARFLRLLEANRFASKTNMVQRSSSSSSSKNNLFRSPPSSVSTVPMTLGDGSRVYVRCSGTNSNSNNNSSTPSSSSGSSCAALGVSMTELIRRVDTMKRRKIAMARKRALTETTATSTGNRSDNDRLWVDKHAPHSFPHLLSDEKTNREVLRALRGWDPYVFGTAPPLRPLYQRQREQELQQQQQQGNDSNNKKFDSKPDTNTTNAADKRPEENARVILLSGPPGVGKTTLAHIVARHAGYRPVEVNASDERSSGVLKDRIQRAMESTTINFKPNTATAKNNDDHGKPNCLILDEIDGADARGSIQALVDIVKAEMPPKNSKQATTYLRRPIICICNHKYAPALRPLLPFAAHFNVEPPSSARLVARLKAILNAEKMPLIGGGSLLHQLVGSNGGDIRSSLFTLQFAAAEAVDAKDLSLALASSLSGTGLKDNRNDIASTISTVFRKQKPRTVPFSSSSKLATKGKDSSVSRVMDAIDGLGDDSAAVNALFLNVPRVSYIDPAFDRCSAAHELLSFAAVSQSGYAIPVVTAGIHLLCRVEVKPNLTFTTREMSDLKYQTESNLGLVQKFSEGLPPKAKNLKCNALLAEEFIPLAMWVLSAGDGIAHLGRAASSIELLTNAEQEAAKNHVAALCALGLTYVIDREKEQVNQSFRAAANEMRMEPPIDRLVEYTSLETRLRRNEIPSKMKELLAHEVLLESFRNRSEKSDAMKEENKETIKAAKSPTKTVLKPTNDETDISSPPKVVTPRKIDDVSPSMPSAKRPKSTPSPTAGNFLGIAAKKGKAAKSARRVAALGLNRAASTKHKLAHSGSGFLLSHVVRMKYVKGFTQAVRTPCRLNDLE